MGESDMCEQCDAEDFGDEFGEIDEPEENEGLETARERVSAGVEFLNRVKPNWRELVNVARLDMNSCQWCVAGQVFKDEAELWNKTSGYDFAEALIGKGDMVEYGFLTSTYYYNVSVSYEDLHTAWTEVLTAE